MRPPGDLLPWSWAEQRLRSAQNYWIATTRPGGQPHCRPVWGVWLADGFWFSTGSMAAHNLPRNSEITVHLEDGQEVVIVEGTGRAETDPPSLQAMCDAYEPKYDYPITPASDGVYDSSGLGGPAQHVIPRVVVRLGQAHGLTDAVELRPVTHLRARRRDRQFGTRQRASIGTPAEPLPYVRPPQSHARGAGRRPAPPPRAAPLTLLGAAPRVARGHS